MERLRKMTDLENKLDEIIKVLKLLQKSLKVEFELIDKRLNELESRFLTYQPSYKKNRKISRTYETFTKIS